MKNEEKVQEFLESILKNHKKQIGFRYPNKEGNGENYFDSIEWGDEVLGDDAHPISSKHVFYGLSRWHLDNLQYQILTKNNLDKSVDYFIKSSAYSYLLVYLAKINFHCKNTVSQEYFLIDQANDYMGRCLLCGWEEEYEKIGNWQIESINYGYQKDQDGDTIYQIISIGVSDILVGWFLLDLYCLAYNKSYNKENADYPVDLLIYQNVLEKWNTTDTTEVDKQVYVMADFHLEQTQEEKNDGEYFSFSDSDLWLFPYEILTWLKLREIHGFKNPKKYSHPLMNTPIVKMFLELKEPLAKPQNLPYAKELLEKFKTTLCPDIEIPEWL